MKIKGTMVAFLFYLGISLGGIGFGTPIDIYSNPGIEGLGSFEGSVDYSYDDAADIGQLIIELTNTSPVDNEGDITGLAFLFPDGYSLDVSGSSSAPSGFELLYSDVSASPFEDYDAGAAVGGSWLGGGKPQSGIGAGETATFYFNLTGTGISELGATSFASNNDFVAVRFRGFSDGGSDKVTGGGGGGAQVPEPATIFLLGSGLLGLFGYRKKFWKSKQSTKE